MTMHTRRGGLVAHLVGVGLLSLLLVGSGLGRAAAQSMTSMDHLKMLSGKDFEIGFLSMMIQHHQDAVDMANMVPGAVNHAEVKTAAANIIRDQTREIAEMTGWLQSWYGMAPDAAMMQEMKQMNGSMMQKLQGLSGDAFDREFLTQMRMHHQSAVEMAQLVPTRATHDELKTLAQNIIRTQTAEITQFETWLKGWYNVDGSGSGMNMGAGMNMGTGMNMGAGTTSTLPTTGAGETPLLLLALLALGIVSLGIGARMLRHSARAHR